MNKAMRGEVWEVTFHPGVGAEIQKTRPAVVMTAESVGKLALDLVVPITEWQPVFANYSWFVRLPLGAGSGLRKESGADAFQTKSVSVQRLTRRLGVLPEEQVEDIAAAVAACVGYKP